MSAGSLCTPVEKQLRCQFRRRQPAYNQLVTGHRRAAEFGKRNAPTVLQLKKDKFLQVLGRQANSSRTTQNRGPVGAAYISWEGILELLLRLSAGRKPRNSRRPQSRASLPDLHRCS